MCGGCPLSIFMYTKGESKENVMGATGVINEADLTGEKLGKVRASSNCLTLENM